MVNNKKLNQPEMHFVPKGWGFEKWIVNTDLYCGKLLYFVKGKRCSIHYHKNKDETFYIQSGKIDLYFSDDIEKVEKIRDHKSPLTSNPLDVMERVVLTRGDNFYIPPGRAHQMIALEDTELIEFSTKHEDSDSYRIVRGD